MKTGERSEGLLKRLKNIEDKSDNQLRAIENNIGNQPSEIKDGISNQPLLIKGRKISDTKKCKFRDANSNEIKELNYLVDYIDNSIESYIKGKKISAQTSSTKDGKPVQKDYIFSDYIDLWPLVKNIWRKFINKGGKKTTKCYRKKD